MGYSVSPEQINMARDGIASYPVRVDFNASGTDAFAPVGTLAAGIPQILTPDS